VVPDVPVMVWDRSCTDSIHSAPAFRSARATATASRGTESPRSRNAPASELELWFGARHERTPRIEDGMKPLPSVQWVLGSGGCACRLQAQSLAQGEASPLCALLVRDGPAGDRE
jgi:hypothetical protein